jgi:hypothetical protein
MIQFLFLIDIHTSLFCTPPELKKVITASDIDKPIDDKTFSILLK